jgi:hypothetical protein
VNEWESFVKTRLAFEYINLVYRLRTGSEGDRW